MSQYSKLFAAILAAMLSAAAPLLISGHMTQVDGINVLLAGLAAAVVYESPNLPGGLAGYAKAVMAGLFAGATLLATLIGTGSLTAVTTPEWTQVGIAVLNTAVVWYVKNGTATLARAA